MKRTEDLTVLHNACAIDKTQVAETIILQTKKRLKLDQENLLSAKEKEDNLNIFKDFINAKTQGDNQTALHYASFRGNIKIIRLLIDNYADINAVTTKGYTMLHKAAQGNKPSAIVYFNKKYKMDLEATEENKMNALHLAAGNGMESAVIYLISLGININAKDKNGFTPLHHAVKKKQIRIIKKLLQRGADRYIPDNKNKTPVKLAEKNKEIAVIFRKKGVCEKLFFKPDINKKQCCSNKNMVLFITLHLLIIFLVFFVLFPFFDNNIFSFSYLGVSALVFILYFSLSFSNPGKMINYQYKGMLDAVEKGEDLENFCSYCLVKNKYRSKHCLICQKCIEEFDHHCFWVGNCIGKNNYTLFFIFLVYVLINALFNVGIIIFFIILEIRNTNEVKKIINSSFPKFFFGVDSFAYNRIFRIIISAFCFLICGSFFFPLFCLFRMQLTTAIEKRKMRKDEKEYERSQLREKLDEEVWEDLTYEDDISSSNEGDGEVKEIKELIELDVSSDSSGTRPLLKE